MLLNMILEKKGKIHTMREVVIPTLGTTVQKVMVNLTTHSKCLSVVAEPVTGYSEHIVTARSYGVLKPGEGKIKICLRNHSARQGILPKQTTVEDIAPTNMIPALLDQKPTGHGRIRRKPLKRKGKRKVKKNY